MAETTRTKLLRGLAESIDAAKADVRRTRTAQAAADAAAATAADALLATKAKPATVAKIRRAARIAAKAAVHAAKAARLAERHLTAISRAYNQTLKPAKRKSKEPEPDQETPAHKRLRIDTAAKLEARNQEKNDSLPIPIVADRFYLRRQALLKAVWKANPDSPLREKDLLREEDFLREECAQADAVQRAREARLTQPVQPQPVQHVQPTPVPPIPPVPPTPSISTPEQLAELERLRRELERIKSADKDVVMFATPALLAELAADRAYRAERAKARG